MKYVLKKILSLLDSSRATRLANIQGSVLKDTKITLIDVGAAGDIEPRWKRMAPFLHYVGFEPDERSLSLLENKSKSHKFEIYPTAIHSSNGDCDLYICRTPTVSSTLKPNRVFLDLFSNKERFDISGEIKVKTSTLDELRIVAPDFLKLDIQGAELYALQGAEETLKKTLGLEIEVEFLELYTGQPLWGDVTRFLSDRGFEFIDFTNICRWDREKFNGIGQAVFGDGLFLRTPEFLMRMENLNPDLIRKYISICILYSRFDLIDKTQELVRKNAILKNIIFIENSQLNELKRRHQTVIAINGLYTKFLRLLGAELRPHLLY